MLKNNHKINENDDLTGAENFVVTGKRRPNMRRKFCSVILGNIAQVIENEGKLSRESEPIVNEIMEIAPNNTAANCVQDFCEQVSDVAMVTTRSSRKNATLHPLILPDVEPLIIDKDKFVDLQKTCPTLESTREAANSGKICSSRNGRKYEFIYKDDLLYRKCV